LERIGDILGRCESEDVLSKEWRDKLTRERVKSVDERCVMEGSGVTIDEIAL